MKSKILTILAVFIALGLSTGCSEKPLPESGAKWIGAPWFDERGGDVTLPAQMVLSCVRRIRDRLGYPVGANLLIDVLRGNGVLVAGDPKWALRIMAKDHGSPRARFPFRQQSEGTACCILLTIFPNISGKGQIQSKSFSETAFSIQTSKTAGSPDSVPRE